MKNFDYTCRAPDGRVARGTVRASDRSEAVRGVRAAGGVPLPVAEARQRGGVRPGLRPALPWGLPCAVLALAAALWFGVGRRPPAPEAAEAIRDPSAASSEAGRSPPVSSVLPAPGDTSETGAREGDFPKVAPAPSAASPAGRDAPGRRAEAAPPAGLPQEGEAASTALAEKMKEPLFRREAEQMLALYAQPGVTVPPTPFSPGFEEDALAALAEDVVVTDADSPGDARRKELVAWMKEDMRRFLAGGGTVKGFFGLVAKRQEEEAELLNEARRVLHALAREGGAEEVLAAHRDLNEALAAKGIAPLPLPGRLRR